MKRLPSAPRDAADSANPFACRRLPADRMAAVMSAILLSSIAAGFLTGLSFWLTRFP
jgi:hypothetical protein